MSEEQENKAVIQTPDQRLRVFVSSALGELAEERRVVSRAISAPRLTTVMFDTARAAMLSQALLVSAPTCALQPAAAIALPVVRHPGHGGWPNRSTGRWPS